MATIELPPLRRREGVGLEIPHPKAMEVIRYLFTPEPRVKKCDLCCGLGFSKTQTCLDIAQMKLEQGPGERVLFLEPDMNRLNKCFVAPWRASVPPSLYKMNEGKREIQYYNGAILYFNHRDIRGNRALAADAGRGPNLTGIIDDESAISFHTEFMVNLLARLRAASPNLFILTATTPKVGPYGNWIKRVGHQLFRGRTIDNPYLKPSPEQYDAELRANMSELQARRELDGELVALEGRIWSGADLTKPYPEGTINESHTEFIPGRDWWLFSDTGTATGAYVVVQIMDKPHSIGPYADNHPVWVAVADYCPNDDASASRAFQRLKTEFGTPVAVVGGMDLGKRQEVGSSIEDLVAEVWGPYVQVIKMSERQYAKQIQFDRLSYLLKSYHGDRHFTVAKNFKSLDPYSKRGVLEALDEYQYRDIPRDSEFLPKGADQPLCHVSDALMMGAVGVMSPPEFSYPWQRQAG